MISPETESQILRLFHAEKWPPGTIATQLGIHHSVVQRVLEQEGVPPAKISRPTLADPFVPFIRTMLKQFPRLCASRLYQMVKERGYSGKPDHFRSVVARYRPPRSAEAYLRLKTLAGDQAQVDWGHFGRIQIGKAFRPLVAFVMVLSYSRAIFLRFFPGQQLSFFLAGHQEAFQRWMGVPRTILYDNLRSAVLERIAEAIRFNPQLVAFAGHYRYEPRPVSPARGNEKGRVERAIRFVRTSFFPARSYDDLSDLNAQADVWCTTTALERPWPEDTQDTVERALERDRAALRKLPHTDFPCHERKEVRVGKTPYVRFDLNDYSVPHTHTRKTLVVVADLDTVRVLDGNEVIARHARSFDRGQQIEEMDHIRTLQEAKRRARKARRSDFLSRVVPSSVELLGRLAEQHVALGRQVTALVTLLDSYGASALEAAVQEALRKGAAHPQAVRHILERNRLEQGEEAALPLPLPDDPRIRQLDVKPHDLTDYDNLIDDDEEDACLV